ncbi:pyridoxamine 5'-phosphate oxidase family protein [Microbacterium sp. Sa4CUA7]|uniref:Pyridoxamine 5'-phosphate oxidase family protein n=1 Tax=Microbacterium pullorum TaxID=2762236 RepID=A0ABR8S013_9MICO|nr:pyridoxamine 5'-phosphate oxidase family protein [Microbacterium pullorum]MBD7956829.1 pyridoxamine 5'-phosphate oxidase family protein [Microbacterium pullorum]
MTEATRSLLRSLPSLAGRAPLSDFGDLPSDPVTLFLEWLDLARASDVAEPHAMTLSTVDASGVPDARILLLKDVDARGWAFASTRNSAKGAQLESQPHAALTFWWQPLARSVRVRGSVVEASREESLADLRARSAAAQEGVAPDDWTLWRVEPTRVEFWQGAPDRHHVRIVYLRDGDGWRIED